MPPCPPPDINLEDWLSSIELLLSKDASRFYLTHFGEITQLEVHMSQLRDMLKDWSDFIRVEYEKGVSPEKLTPLFCAYTKKQLLNLGVSEQGTQQYEAANPSWMSVAGLIRYWKKKQAI